MAAEHPTGTVTFLFTDLVGSTGLWHDEPEAMATALTRHDALLRAAFSSRGGYVFSTGGDGFGVAFHKAADAPIQVFALCGDGLRTTPPAGSLGPSSEADSPLSRSPGPAVWARPGWPPRSPAGGNTTTTIS